MPDDLSTATITHLPLDQQWTKDSLNAGPFFAAFEEAVGVLEAHRVRKIVLARLAEGVRVCEILGTDPEKNAPGHSFLANDQVWRVTQFTAEAPEPVIEAGCKVHRASFESNDGAVIDFRLVSR